MRDTQQKRLPAGYTALVLGILLILQVCLTLSSFKSFEHIVNTRPVLNVDFCSQYYWANAARELASEHGRMWGYDPFFMAGYPLDFVFNSALPVQLVAVVFKSQDLARIIKLLFIGSFALAPLSLYFSMRWFGLGRGPALCASALGVVYFWVSECAFFGRMGMISGAFLLHFFLVPLSLIYRFMHLKENRAYALLLFALAASLTVHKTAFVLVLPIALVWILMFSPSLRPRDLMLLVGAFAFVLMVNLHWLYPFFRFMHLKTLDPATTFFQNVDPFRWIKDMVPLQPFYALPLARLLIVATGIGGLFFIRHRSPALAAPLLAAVVFFLLLSYFGSFSERLMHLQPYRYVTAYFFMWLPASGWGLKRASDWIAATRIKGGRAIALALFAAALAALLLLPSFLAFSRAAPLTTTLDKNSRELVSWVRENTDRSARILIEDINVWEGQYSDVYGGARLVHLLPLLTPRELIGGPLPNAFIKHHYAGFHDGLLLTRPVSEYTDQDLDRAMELYNIGWVVCFSASSRERMSRYQGARLSETFGKIEAYVLDRERDFFLQGSGSVKAKLGKIELSSVSTPSGLAVVSYHWVDGLQSCPPAELVKVSKGGDPVGFIGIVNPPQEITIGLGI